MRALHCELEVYWRHRRGGGRLLRGARALSQAVSRLQVHEASSCHTVRGCGLDTTSRGLWRKERDHDEHEAVLGSITLELTQRVPGGH